MTDDTATQLINRLNKNHKQLRRWLKRDAIYCFRLYDGDIPEFAFAVDVYQGEKRWVYVQEYQAPPSVEQHKVEQRRASALAGIGQALQVESPQLFFRVRKRQKGKAQYEKVNHEGRFHEVREGPARFLVNFSDYLDTGLFLDHRITRGMIADAAQGKRFLNLFAYTGSATVYSAYGGAASTTTVDMSNTYLRWAQRNMDLNGFTEAQRHRFVRADCLTWLRQQKAGPHYDLMFIDPPSFSASKKMSGTFDVQRDHVALLQQAARILAPDGVIFFSNNLRSFKLDKRIGERFEVHDISPQTIPRDFARNPRIHGCWTLSPKPIHCSR